MPFSVLVIDDDPVLRGIVANFFTGQGMKADLAMSGESGIRRLKHRRYDFLVTDLEMEFGDGFSVLSYIEEIKGAKPITFVITGNHGMQSRNIRELGAEAVLYKPFSLDALYQLMSERIKRKVTV